MPKVETTEAQKKLWRLIVLASVCALRQHGATEKGLRAGLTLLGQDVVWGCLKTLEEAGMIYRRPFPSGHPSGSLQDRWFPEQDVRLDFQI
jgi:hypothetical protein